MTRARWVLAGLIAALAAVGLITGLTVRGLDDPATGAVHADFTRVLGAVEAYRKDHGGLPDEEESLGFLVPRYLPSVPQDPWGKPYEFSSDGERAFVVTWGRDGVRGGVGPNEDHTQHDGHGDRSPALRKP